VAVDIYGCMSVLCYYLRTISNIGNILGGRNIL
jgi:hypothetical protein